MADNYLGSFLKGLQGPLEQGLNLYKQKQDIENVARTYQSIANNISQQSQYYTEVSNRLEEDIKSDLMKNENLVENGSLTDKGLQLYQEKLQESDAYQDAVRNRRLAKIQETQLEFTPGVDMLLNKQNGMYQIKEDLPSNYNQLKTAMSLYGQQEIPSVTGQQGKIDTDVISYKDNGYNITEIMYVDEKGTVNREEIGRTPITSGAGSGISDITENTDKKKIEIVKSSKEKVDTSRNQVEDVINNIAPDISGVSNVLTAMMYKGKSDDAIKEEIGNWLNNKIDDSKVQQILNKIDKYTLSMGDAVKQTLKLEVDERAKSYEPKEVIGHFYNQGLIDTRYSARNFGFSAEDLKEYSEYKTENKETRSKEEKKIIDNKGIKVIQEGRRFKVVDERPGNEGTVRYFNSKSDAFLHRQDLLRQEE